MHFRHFLLSGLMIGAAMLFPEDAFAEKPNTEKRQVSSSIVNEVPVTAENVQSLGKKAVVTKPALENKSNVKQLPKTTPPPTTMDKLPDQANEKAQSVMKNPDRPLKSTGTAIPASTQAKVLKEQKTPKLSDGNGEGRRSLRDTNSEVKVEVQSGKVEKSDENKRDDSEAGFSTVDKGSESLVQEPQQTPANKEDTIPKINQILNQSQRTNSSGGQSTDRANLGLSSISLWDKWFEWNRYDEIQLIQPYRTRYALLNTQWVNAPPAPPPQNAPFLNVSTAA